MTEPTTSSVPTAGPTPLPGFADVAAEPALTPTTTLLNRSTSRHPPRLTGSELPLEGGERIRTAS